MKERQKIALMVLYAFHGETTLLRLLTALSILSGWAHDEELYRYRSTVMAFTGSAALFGEAVGLCMKHWRMLAYSDAEW
jgi:hypothetical protein